MIETLVRGHYKHDATADVNNVGDGAISGLAVIEATPTETWTLTCTAEALNSGTFSVVGSVSGAKADLTVAVAYDNGQIALTVADGAEDWDIGDVIIVDVIRNLSYNTPTPPNGVRKMDTLEANFTGDVTAFVYTIDGALGSTNEYELEAEKTLSAGELTAKGTIYAPTNAFSVSNITVSGLAVTVTSEATFEVILATT